MLFGFDVCNTNCLLLRTVSEDNFFVGGFMCFSSMGEGNGFFLCGDLVTIVNPSSISIILLEVPLFFI